MPDPEANMKKREFLAPEYYERFSCKCGDCRVSCCGGWGITVDMAEYYRLLGAAVSPQMRVKLDCALKMVENPSRERYAKLGPGWDMNCPLLDASGLCALQKECGEEMLPEVCRIYPRAFRETYAPEAAMSASCERVIELLMEIQSPMRFHKALIPAEKTENLPPRPGIHAEIHAEIRKSIVHALQNRTLPLSARLTELFSLLNAYDAHADRSSAVYKGIFSENARADQNDCFRLSAGICAILGGRSLSLTEYLADGFENLGIPVSAEAPGEEILKRGAERYFEARMRFEEKFPQWEIWFEQIFVNHVFFTDFPWSDVRETVTDEFVALGVTYIVVKFTSVAYMLSRESVRELTDVIAACFRLIEHSAFDRSACSALMLLEDEHCVNFLDAIARV